MRDELMDFCMVVSAITITVILVTFAIMLILTVLSGGPFNG